MVEERGEERKAAGKVRQKKVIERRGRREETKR